MDRKRKKLSKSEVNRKRREIRKRHKTTGWTVETSINELLALDKNDPDYRLNVQVIGEEMAKYAAKQPPVEPPVDDSNDCFICAESIFTGGSRICSCSACNQVMHLDCIVKWRQATPGPMNSACCKSNIE